MADEQNGANEGERLARPFPSRREVHGGRIPQRPDNAPEPPMAGSIPATNVADQSAALKEEGAATPSLPRRQPPRRQRTTERNSSAASHAGWAQTRRAEFPAQTDTPNVAETPTKVEPASQPQPPTEPATPPAAHDVKPSAAEADPASPSPAEADPLAALPGNRRSATHSRGRRADDDRGSNVSERRRKAQRRRRIWTAILAFLIIGALAAGTWLAFRGATRNGGSNVSAAEDFPGPGHGEVSITIDPGALGTQMAQALYDAGVIKSTAAFVAAFNANAASSSIKPGTYTLKYEMSAADALAALLDDANRTENTVTVIPGQTVTQVYEKMISVGGFSQQDIDAIIADPSSVGLPAAAGGVLEGWLWAGSYEISSDDTAGMVISRMVENTVDFLTEQGVPEDRWQQTLTIASIVEREVAWDEYMPKVARVIMNRMSDPAGETLGMLQMDSTVLYGVDKVGGIPTTEDIEDDNPYNTYRIVGLPPTPISTPSLNALEATLNPEEGNWLYFVTVNLQTGETLFTDSYEQTMRDWGLLQQWCQDNPGQC